MSNRGLVRMSDEAIAAAEANVRSLARDYIRWASEDLERSLAKIREIRGAQGTPLAGAAELFTIFHNIKGQGGTFDYLLVTAIATIACNILRDRETVPAEALAVVENCAYAMQGVLKRGLVGNGGENGRELTRKLLAMARPWLQTSA